MLRYFMFCFLLFGAANAGFGQVSKKAKEYWEQAKKLKDSGYYDSAAIVADWSIEADWKDAKVKKKDTAFLAKARFFQGEALEAAYKDGKAANAYWQALQWYQYLGNVKESRKAMYRLSSAANYASYWGYEGLPDWVKGGYTNQDTTQSTYTKVYVLETTQDSIKATFYMGRAQGLEVGTRVYLVCGPDNNPDDTREFTLAHGDVQTLDENSCTLWMLRNNTDTFVKGDVGIVKLNIAKELTRGMITRMIKYNIQFVKYFSDEYYYTREAVARYRGIDYDQLIIDDMVEEMHFAADSFRRAGLGLMDTLINQGRYKGYTFYQAMKSVTRRDVIYYLDYVYTYAGSYNNKEIRLVYGMTNWLNYKISAPGDIQLILNPIFEAKTKEEIAFEAKNYGYYFRSFLKGDSLAEERFKMWELWNNDQKDIALQKLELLMHYARMVSDSQLLNAFLIKSVAYLYDLKRYDEGLKKAAECYQLGVNKYTSALYMGVFYSSLDKEDESIKILDSALQIDSLSQFAIGYKGWQYTKKARYKMAEPLCRKAWQMDSFVTWTNVNLAHVYQLTGRKEEAHRLYLRSLKYMENVNHYFTGLAVDFDYFIKNGVNADEFLALKTRYAKEFIAQYKIKLEADSIFQLGKKKHQQFLHEEAGYLFEKAAQREEENPNLRIETLRVYYNWSGFAFYKAKNYKESIKRYLKAKEIAETRGLSEEVIIDEIENVRNIYDWLGDTVAYRIYSDKYEALSVALSEKQDQKKLYILSLGLNHSGAYGEGAEQDAEEIAEQFRKPALKYFDQVEVVKLHGKALTYQALMQAIDTAILTLQPNDILLLYYNGKAYGRNLDHTLSLYDYSIKTKDLLGLLGQVSVRRQIHLMDCNGTRWEDLYNREKFGHLASEKNSLVFMGMNNARIPQEKGGRSIMTSALLEAFKHPEEDGRISAGTLVSNAWHYFLERQWLFPMRQLHIGHDIPLGIAEIVKNTTDSTGPKIEVYNATKLRDGTNISLVDRRKELTGKVTDQSKVLVLTINGVTVKLNENGRFTYPMDSIKGTEVEVFAADENGFTTKSVYKVRETALAGNQAMGVSGTRYAWIFATDTYAHWGALANPVHDAERLAEVLRNWYGYKVRLVLNNNKKEIRAKLDSIRRVHYKPGDQLMVFFAGHGHYDSIYGGYIVCAESELPGPGIDYGASYISQMEVANLLNDVSAVNVFLAMDVCYGGKMFDKQMVKPYFGSNTYNISDDEFVQRKMTIPCRQFLTSAGNEPALDGVVGVNSPFANKFIEALETEASKKAYITLFDLIGYMGKLPTQPRYGPFGASHPDGEYVFKVVNKPSVAAQ